MSTTLAENRGGTCTATLQGQTTRRFDASDRLTKIADRHGNASTLAHHGQGQTASGSDPAAARSPSATRVAS